MWVRTMGGTKLPELPFERCEADEVAWYAPPILPLGAAAEKPKRPTPRGEQFGLAPPRTACWSIPCIVTPDGALADDPGATLGICMKTALLLLEPLMPVEEKVAPFGEWAPSRAVLHEEEQLVALQVPGARAVKPAVGIGSIGACAAAACAPELRTSSSKPASQPLPVSLYGMACGSSSSQFLKFVRSRGPRTWGTRGGVSRSAQRDAQSKPRKKTCSRSFGVRIRASGVLWHRSRTNWFASARMLSGNFAFSMPFFTRE
mmetsp:Transcript_64068/g.103628  ORF Transcript_64068/g.103628 Transcript_64068/m.103628 type:complete len:260 (-) Transcript_64068:1077-1856(-)